MSDDEKGKEEDEALSAEEEVLDMERRVLWGLEEEVCRTRVDLCIAHGSLERDGGLVVVLTHSSLTVL